ncbi:MAG: ABC transporter ATP-binding protein [Syntrophomonadaceae bacterium]|nr:ABC transporter ATP-binding protein [Syntrophomonadaceae bacterium]
MNNNCIVLQGVNKYYGKKQVLKDINLQVPYGQIFGLLGPSGCGKTTIVKIMTGILPANSGEVYVLNEVVPKLEVMNKIGYMAQSDALYNTLTARENLEFFGTVYGMKKTFLYKRIDEVMAVVKLSEDLDKEVMAYSGGMKRRLSLAIAILHNPPVLLLDEPTVGIDPLLRQDIWTELYKMTEQGVTIIVTTHVMDEAVKCHELAMMREGQVIAQGTADELQARIGAKTIEEAFIYYGGNKYEG